MNKKFLHNRHDCLSTDALAQCIAYGLTIDETIDVYAGERPDFGGCAVSRLPAYVVVANSGAVIASFEGSDLDPALISSLEFVEPDPQPVVPTIEEIVTALQAEVEDLKVKIQHKDRQIAELEEGLAMVYLEVSKTAIPSDT